MYFLIISSICTKLGQLDPHEMQHEAAANEKTNQFINCTNGEDVHQEVRQGRLFSRGMYISKCINQP